MRKEANGTPGLFGRLFTSYDKIEESWRGSVVYGQLSRVHTTHAAGRFRRAVSQSVERSAILRVVRSAGAALPRITARTYGVFLLSFGLYAAMIFAIRAVASSLTADTDMLVGGLCAMAAAIPLLASGKTIFSAISTGRLSSYIAFDVLGFRKSADAVKGPPIQRLDMAFLSGMIAGLLTFYFSPDRIIGALLSAVLIYVVMARPETGMLLIYAAFPFLGDGALLISTAAVLVSYLCKLACGRRTLRVDAASLLALSFFILYIFGGFVHYGAGAEGVFPIRRVVFMTSYFLSCNLITNAEWRARLLRAMMFGASMLAVVSLVSLASPFLPPLTDVGSAYVHNLYAYGEGVFEAASESSYYLAMMLPVMMAYVMKHGGGKRVNMIFFSALVTAAAVMTMSRGLWLGVIAGVMVLMMMINIKLAYVPAALFILVPAVSLALPPAARSWLSGLLDNTGRTTRGRVLIRQRACGIFADNILGGIGTADGVFAGVYNAVSPVGASATNAQSLPLEIGVELGVVGLFVFIAAMALLLMRSATSLKRGSLISGAFAAGLCAALFSGMSNYIWIDDRMFLLFWLFAGALSAYSACGDGEQKREYKQTSVSGNGECAEADIVF